MAKCVGGHQTIGVKKMEGGMDSLPLPVSFPRKAERAAQAPRGDGKAIPGDLSCWFF